MAAKTGLAGIGEPSCKDGISWNSLRSLTSFRSLRSLTLEALKALEALEALEEALEVFLSKGLGGPGEGKISKKPSETLRIHPPLTVGSTVNALEALEAF